MEPVCPWCGGTLEEIGSIGIADMEGRREAQATRYKCPNNHMVFVVKNADALLDAEAANLSIDDDDDDDDDSYRALSSIFGTGAAGFMTGRWR